MLTGRAQPRNPCACVRRLEEAYEAAKAQQGGLQARPKQLLNVLQEEFPDLTLQVGMGSLL